MIKHNQSKKSFFSDLFYNLSYNLNKIVNRNNQPINQNLTFDEIFKYFLVIIPVHAILYLYIYYNNFDTQYFLYFNPVDFINVFYTNNLILIAYAVIIGFILLFFAIIYISVADFKLKTNYSIFLGCFFFILLLIISKLKIQNIPFQLFFTIGIMMFSIIFITKQAKLPFYFVVGCFFFHTIYFAELKALETKKNKLNFNIILNDNTYVLKLDTLKSKDYFIGKTTDYVFVYSDSIKKVRVVPVKEIKEIQFPMIK